jgi:hypothetical protein
MRTPNFLSCFIFALLPVISSAVAAPLSAGSVATRDPLGGAGGSGGGGGGGGSGGGGGGEGSSGNGGGGVGGGKKPGVYEAY